MTTFTDMELPVHWEDHQLYDDMYVVGQVTRTLAGTELGWMADPYWNEDMHFFDTEEEAKAWLLTMYRMGGRINYGNLKGKRRVRP
jgi:hypothetical protein